MLYIMPIYMLAQTVNHMEINKESVKYGAETALEMCLAKIAESKTIDEAYAKVNELLTLAKTDRIGRFEESLWTVRR